MCLDTELDGISATIGLVVLVVKGVHAMATSLHVPATVSCLCLLKHAGVDRAVLASVTVNYNVSRE
jgi:hypothetical protein